MAFPPKPANFAPNAAPPGVEYRHVLFSRPKLTAPARILLIHTNAANGEGSLESAWNWAHRNLTDPTKDYTTPTYQVDRSGRARKMLSSDEDAICNCTMNSAQDGHGDVSEWSLAIETADTGTIADPTISAFTDAQVETLATIVAYESMVWGFPIDTPTEWFGSGVAGHTDPFGFPYWTCVTGKICPGSKKKAQIRNLILPRARAILAHWTEITPPPEDDDMAKRYLARLDTNANHYRVGDGIHAVILRSNEYAGLASRFNGSFPGPEPAYYNPWTGNRITSWAAVPVLNETQLDLDVGYVTEAGKVDEG